MGGKQISLLHYDFTTAKKQTKREKLLAEMEVVVGSGLGGSAPPPWPPAMAARHGFQRQGFAF